MLKENLKSITPGCLQGLSAPSTSCLKFEASFVGGGDRGRGMVGLGWVGHAVRRFEIPQDSYSKSNTCIKWEQKNFLTPDSRQRSPELILLGLEKNYSRSRRGGA